jgi:RNA polymerase sigma-70 factor (ECF subfamily)
MSNEEWLGEFDQQRNRLRSIAAQVLGSSADADDAVQEAWLRLSRAQTDTIENPSGWLTTVVSRIALDMLRARGTRDRTSDALAGTLDPDSTTAAELDDPALSVELADGVTAALMVVLDALQPAERVAFVLHDSFGVPFNDIGAVLGRSPAAAKQLASRARVKVRGTDESTGRTADRDRAVVDAFLAAARAGRLDELVAALAPDVELHADLAGISMGAPAHLAGALAVAESFSGRAMGASAGVIDGVPGMVWIVGERPKVAWEFTVENGRVARIDMVADPVTLDGADIEVGP